jgi:hypothetical protein
VDASGKVGSDAAHRGGQALVGWQGAVGAAHVLVEGGSGGVAAASGAILQLEAEARGTAAMLRRSGKKSATRGGARGGGSSSHL